MYSLCYSTDVYDFRLLFKFNFMFSGKKIFIKDICALQMQVLFVFLAWHWYLYEIEDLCNIFELVY